MYSERELGLSLREKSAEHLESQYCDAFNGIWVTHPYKFIKAMPGNGMVEPSHYRSYQICEEVFSIESMPPNWLSFLNEVGREHSGRGCNSPINLIYYASDLANQHPRAAELGIDPLAEDDYGLPIVNNKEEIQRLLDQILGDSCLRKAFIKILSTAVPAGAPGELDKTPFLKAFKQLGIHRGVFVDLGCGWGEKTLEWHAKTCLTTVGLERRDFPVLAGHASGTKSSRLSFIRADFVRGIPIISEGVDVAVMEYVVCHLNDQGLEKAVGEISRVLKSGSGLLAVGPQQTDSDEEWRVFRKASRMGNEPLFAELPLREILSSKDSGSNT